ncbi:MAG: hypothetical protein ACLFSW_05720 [Halobacteriales archaeon]
MEIKLNEVGELLEELDYPVTNEDVVNRFGDVTLLLADGEEVLGYVLTDSDEESFGSPTELEEEIYANLPKEAVGEPGQSEGDA